jgi:hypothetical protein
MGRGFALALTFSAATLAVRGMSWSWDGIVATGLVDPIAPFGGAFMLFAALTGFPAFVLMAYAAVNRLTSSWGEEQGVICQSPYFPQRICVMVRRRSVALLEPAIAQNVSQECLAIGERVVVRFQFSWLTADGTSAVIVER